MDVSRDGLPVDREAYGDRSPFAFTGTLNWVVFDLRPAPHEDEKKLHEVAHHAAARDRPQRVMPPDPRMLTDAGVA